VAAKSKAPAKAVKKPKAAVKTKVKKVKSPTAGLNAAQVKKYNAAAKKVTASQNLRTKAASYRQRRLATAKRVTAKQRSAYKTAAASRAVSLAVQKTYQQTVSGHQAAYLRKSAAARVFKAQSIASSRKFVALGEGTHAHTSRMQTVTSAQANAIEKKLIAKATQTAKTNAARKAKAFKHLKKIGKIGKNAKTIPKGYSINVKGQLVKTKKRPKKVAVKKKKGSTGNSPAAIRAGLKAARTPPTKAALKAAAQSKKKPVKAAAKPKASVITPAVNPRWVTAGNDKGVDNCLSVAIANHLLAWTDYRLDDDQVNSIPGETVYDALRYLQESDPFDNVHVEMFAELTDTHHDIPGSLICFYTPKHIEHAGLLLGSGMISWGEVSPIPETVTEAWYIRWRVHG
jgi:hypothetical protein